MASSSSRSEKQCLYDVLEISKTSSPEEIRSSYRRLALQRHPDKLIKAGGISESEATAQFQELVHAYEVLSDPKERAWYDSHRSKILFADNVNPGESKQTVPDLFGFFSSSVYSGFSDTRKGFFKVYYDVFNSVYLTEIKFMRKLGLSIDSVKEAPIMGNLESPYAQVTAFYNYWLGFSTVMDFCWVDEYDAMAGPSRKMRRLMEEHNKKARKKAKKEYSETVRRLAEFVKKRDKRVIDMMVKKNEEMVKKKEEEKERKKKMEKEKLERAMNYEEPDWAKAQDGDEEEEGLDVVAEEEEDGEKKEQLYCIVCSKKFKSEKQWKNHEQSKKHKEKVAELRESFSDIDEEEETNEKLQEELNIEEDVEEEVVGEADETDDEYFVAEEEYVIEASEDEDEDEDDEMSLLKNLISRQKNKQKNVVYKQEEEEAQAEAESETTEFNEFDNQKTKGTDDVDNTNATDKAASEEIENSQKDEPMKYDNRKTTGRRRRSKKDKNSLGGLMEKKSNEADDDTQYRKEESHSEKFEDRSEYIEHKKAPRSKKSTRGMKNKSTSKKASNTECDKCGEDFESRSKLFKHVADTGHATVKSR